MAPMMMGLKTWMRPPSLTLLTSYRYGDVVLMCQGICGDYEQTAGELTLEPGQIDQAFFVRIMDDHCRERRVFTPSDPPGNIFVVQSYKLPVTTPTATVCSSTGFLYFCHNFAHRPLCPDLSHTDTPSTFSYPSASQEGRPFKESGTCPS